MLTMVEKEIRGGLCCSINRYAKADNKYMEDFDRNQESSYLKCGDVNNLYSWTMSQKLSVNEFKWVEDLSKFNEDFIESNNENTHCVKSVQTRRSFWSVFFCIQTEYRDLQSKFLYSVQTQKNTDQKKLRIWTLFTQ